ncbi:hypothetical protein [Niveispirillum fermenti]|uniref:hypothetical protein n=1 Tax=Niveispirillum fermenti TaxID=1233113 RepID=UPI003A895B2E
MTDLPAIALSVRQPWAWAIVTGFKDIENRSRAAVSKGDMRPRPIAIHAALGMTRAEYEDAADTMARIGVTCPRPDDLIRGAIVGAATVTAIVDRHPSPWFFGPRGLVLANARAVTPIPAAGKLGYFEWHAGGMLPPPLPWMRTWPNRAAQALVLDILFNREDGR